MRSKNNFKIFNPGKHLISTKSCRGGDIFNDISIVLSSDDLNKRKILFKISLLNYINIELLICYKSFSLVTS